ncbi:Pm3-like protein [Hordeum vulgare]|nr:Pm3-like protein [Hordeum vulgare]
MMDVLMKRCIGYIHRHIMQIPDRVAEKLLEKLNKKGVMYNPVAVVPSCNNDGDDEVDSFENGPREKKEFMYKEDNHSENSVEPIIHLTHTREAVPKEKNKAEEKTPPKINVKNGGSPKKANDEYDATPKNPSIINNSPQATSSNIYIMPSCVTKFMDNAKGKRLPTIGKDDEVLSGKRKRTVPKKFESPYTLDKPSRPSACGTRPSGTTTAIRALSSEYGAPKAHLSPRVGNDRHLCPAWRSGYLVDWALAQYNTLPSCYIMDSELSRSGAVDRVKDEYTLCAKTYLALNVGNIPLDDRGNAHAQERSPSFGFALSS